MGRRSVIFLRYISSSYFELHQLNGCTVYTLRENCQSSQQVNLRRRLKLFTLQPLTWTSLMDVSHASITFSSIYLLEIFFWCLVAPCSLIIFFKFITTNGKFVCVICTSCQAYRFEEKLWIKHWETIRQWNTRNYKVFDKSLS